MILRVIEGGAAIVLYLKTGFHIKLNSSKRERIEN